MADWAEDAEAQEETESQAEVLVGVAKEWVPPKGAGPGRFTLHVGDEKIKCQVWPREYQSEEENEQYAACKNAAVENLEVTLEGQGEWQTYTVKKGPHTGKEAKSFQFTVWNLLWNGLASGERNGKEDDPNPVSDVAAQAQATIEKILETKQSNRRSSGTAPSNGSKAASGDRMSKAEWAEKDRLKQASINSWAAVKVAGNLMVAAGKFGLKDLESAARGVIAIQAKLNQELLSTSTSSEASETGSES